MSAGPSYITVKELSERAGVSIQSIYKRINNPGNPIQKYIKQETLQLGKGKLLDIAVLRDLYGIDPENGILNQTEPNTTQTEPKLNDSKPDLNQTEPHTEPKLNQTKPDTEPKLNQENDNIQLVLELLRDEIREKNETIKDLTRLLDQEQTLHRITKDQLQSALESNTLLLQEREEGKKDYIEPVEMPDVDPVEVKDVDPVEDEPVPVKKGIIKKIMEKLKRR